MIANDQLKETRWLLILIPMQLLLHWDQNLDQFVKYV